MQPHANQSPGEELLPYHRIIIVPSGKGRDKYSIKWDLDMVKEEKKDDDDRRAKNVTAYKRSPWLYIKTEKLTSKFFKWKLSSSYRR